MTSPDFVNTAATLNVVVPQSGHMRIVVSVEGGPVDLTGYTGAMQVRVYKEAAVTLASVNPLHITVNYLTRQVVVDVPASVTALYDWDEALYDLYIVGTDSWRICEGRMRLSKTVTREA